MTTNLYKKKFPPFILIFLFVIFEGMRVTLTPAFSEELTSQSFISLSHAQYAYLYVPFSLMAMIAALFSGFLIRKRGQYYTFSLVIILDLISLYFFGMALITYFFKTYAFIFLSIALALSGAGFGLALPLINTVVAKLFPKKTTSAIVSIYLSLTIGSFILYFFTDYLKQYIGIGISFLALMLIVFFLVFNFYEVFPKVFVAETKLSSYKNIWSMIVAMICIGALEGFFFNWTILFASSHFVDSDKIYLGFLIFFIISQITYAILVYWLPFNPLFILVPTCLALTLVLGSFLFSTTSVTLIFCLVGSFLSANLPFMMAYAKKMFGIQPLVWGFLTASYEFGYGISSYGLGTISSMVLNHFLLTAFIFAAVIILMNIITVINYKRAHNGPVML